MPPQNPTPPVPSTNPAQRSEKNESAGPIIGAAVIVILLILGGLYFWSVRLDHQNSQAPLPFITGDATS